MNKTKKIKFIDIKSIEFVKGESSILVLFLSLLIGHNPAYKQQDKLIITLKNDVIFVYYRNETLKEFKEAVKLIQRSINTPQGKAS